MRARGDLTATLPATRTAREKRGGNRDHRADDMKTEVFRERRSSLNRVRLSRFARPRAVATRESGLRMLAVLPLAWPTPEPTNDTSA